MLSTAEAAKILQTSRDTVRRLCNSGVLASEKVRPIGQRGHLRIRLDNLIAYAERNGITLILPESEQK